jgi:DNA-binding NarL/FixJ family response regulator
MLFKSHEFDRELWTALDAIADGRRYFSGTVQAAARRVRMQPNAFLKILSGREIDVLKLIASGFADHEIAAILAIGGSTVCSHRQRIMAKIGVHSSAKLLLWAHEKGFGLM